MRDYDGELEQLRAGVSCAVLLERQAWRLDQKESTRGALKYRRGAGEILIVNHEGRGWWDTNSTAKGDVFALAQFLEPGLNFGQVRKVLRPLIGLSPSLPPYKETRRKDAPEMPVARRWERRQAPRPGSPCWRYLTIERCLPEPVIMAAITADSLKEGPQASAWFAHRDHDGRLTGIEMRGPQYRGFTSNTDKTLFRWTVAPAPAHRLFVTEAPIDAMSAAAIEGLRADTLYVGTAGGLGPETLRALEMLFSDMAQLPGAVVIMGTDNDAAGHRYAARLAAMAEAAGLPTERVTPVDGHQDWNNILQAGRGL